MNQAYDANRVTNRDRRPNLTLAQQIALLERSIARLIDAGLDPSFYQNALAALKGAQS